MIETEISLAELCDRFEKIYTGALTDVLDELHYYYQTLPVGLKAIAFGMRTVGAAFPVTGHPKRQPDYDTALRPVLKMLGEVPAHSVAVYQTHDNQGAHLGELSVASIKTRGCRGAVIDGGVRDVEYILREGFPVWSRYTTPVDAVPRWQITGWNCPVTIGEVRIEPGDLIVADCDGVVAVPRKLASQVLLACEEVVQAENRVREAVRQGVLPLEAYEQCGEF